MRSGVLGIFPAFRAAFRGALALFSALAQVNGVRAAFVSCFFALAVFAAQAAALTHSAAAQTNAAADTALQAEIQKTLPDLPDLAVVRQALGAGANPDATVGGVPLLFKAGRLGHADVVSVLVTFGVNVSANVHADGATQYFPEYMSHNGLNGGAPAATGKGALPWRDAAEVVIHFGEALKVSGAAYDWANNKGKHWPLDYLRHRYDNFDSVRNYPATVAAMKVMAGYLLDQESPCYELHWGTDHLLCTSRPTCTATDGVLYSCSECAGYPHLSVDGAACVAANACRSYASVNAAVWPSPQCECDNGAANSEGECPDSFDKDLVAEVEKTEPGPVLSSVRALLNAGADPDATGTGGLPLLFEAGRRGHADIVSVLVTFGVNASVKVDGNQYFPEYMSENGLDGGAPAATGQGVLPWRDAAEVVIHFGEALKVFALTSTTGTAYDWANTKGGNLPLDYLHHRYNKFDSVKNYPATVAAVEAMAGYMLDQGSPCIGYVKHPICTSRPTCPATGGVLYSCSECAGYPHLSVDGAACVADGGCRADASANAAVWPSPQCECDNGAVKSEGECPDLFDKNLVDEVEKTEPGPVLSSVRALLNAGADPEVTGTGGLPLLFEAGRRGHADVVSVLVTFGVNVSVKINNRYFPEYMSENGLDGGAPAATGKGVLPWRDAADVVIHFGEALKVFALTSATGAAYDWANTKGKFLPLDYLQHRYNKFDSVKNDPAALAVMKVMAGYMLDQGSPCNVAYINHAICTSRPECPAIGGSPYYTCSECAGYPHISADGAACVADGGCRAGASANAAAWPASQCECHNGALNAAGECPDLSDAALIAEVEKTEPGPVLSSVRALLNAGADPDAAWRPGVPLLLAAATLGHAQIVSVLVTAGANPQAADFSYYDLDVVQHAATPLDARAAGPRSLRASVLYHFGGGLDVRNAQFGDADFDWNREDRNGYRAMDRLHNATKAAKVTLAGEDRAVIDGMANYMLARGANCGYRTGDRTQGVCVGSGQVSLVRSSLFDELEKAPGTADTSEFLRLLGEEGGHPDIENSDRRPLLILAARNGHADLVSILVTLGANVNAEDGTFHRLNVAHHMATPMSDPAAGPRSLRASVLYHFSGALDVRNARSGDAGFDWNKPDANKFRALDILVNATADNKRNLEGENVTVIYEMAEHMREEGARCGYRTSNKLREVCLGRAGLPLAQALIETVKDPNIPAADVRAAAQAAQASGVHLDDVDDGGGHILAAAAQSGHAAAVSVLLTFGVNPDGRGSNNRGVLHFVGQNNGASAPTQLRVLRHFIGGLEVAGKTDSFNGWNAGSGVGRPLDALQNNGVGVAEGLAERREIYALLYERGARCATPAEKTYCQIPAEAALIPANAPSTGPVLTITVTRPAFGGASFDLRLPDAGARAALTMRGWEMARLAGPPLRVVVRRTRELRSGDDLPTVAVTMVNGEHAARQIHVVAQADVLPLFVTVVGSGSVSILAGGQPLDSGSVPENLNIQIVAEPDSLAYHVSAWGGPCAGAPKGADSGGRACDFLFNGRDNRVTVTFSPGRLWAHVPAAGNLPDWRGGGTFAGTGMNALTYFCRLFGVSTAVEQKVLFCPIFGSSDADACDSSAGGLEFSQMTPCGSSHFRHIRDCNAENKPALNRHSCGTPCDAAAGMVAFVKSCVSVEDQCASPLRVCASRASCLDPHFADYNTPVELCTCNGGLTGDGVNCSGEARAVSAKLLEEALKAPGVAAVSAVVGHLNDGANPNTADENGVPVLIAAATLGHTEIVSVLVTAGADPNARDGSYKDWSVVHHIAAPLTDPAAGPRSLRASVLYHFSAALDVRNALFGGADFDWKQEDQHGNRALDILVNATAADKITLAGEDLAVIYEMAEHMREEGARCGYRTSNKLREICLGSAGLPLAQALIETVKDPNIPAADVRAAARAAQASGVHLDDVDDGGGHILAVAAQSGHAAAVSILLTFGVNPDGRSSNNNRGVLHFVGRNSDISAPLQLRILRHFIAGLDAAGKADSFNGWNAHVVNVGGRPLDALQGWASSPEALAEKREIHALLYERGARCGSPGSKTYCQIPAETLLIPANLPNTGAVLTVTARDFGGTSFDLQLPDAVAVATMSLRGWEMTLPAGSPARVVLSRTGALSPGDEFPTVAVTMLNGEQAVRRVNIAGQSGLAPFFVTVVGPGSVSIVTNGKPIQSGGSVLPNQRVKITASPDSLAYHVSLWSGPCAAARKGADGGERTCEFIFNGEDNRVTVSFSPGRLARHLPASGKVPDSRYGILADTKTNALDYFCGLFGGGLEFRSGNDGVPRPICFLFGHILAVNGCDSHAGGYGNVHDCGNTDFKHIRDCNAANKPMVNRASFNHASCGEPCDAAAGMAAFGKSCVPVADQCAASSSSPCAPRASCSDRDVVIDNTPAELCACNNGLAGDGVTCGERVPTANLLAEALKTSGEADANAVAGYLSAGANPNIADENGVPALVAAAKLGRAEIVSVLVTAGADPNAKDPTFHDLNVAQHMATPLTDPAAGPRDARASVLYHFSAALDVRNTMFGGANFDWNREDRNGHRALDILVLAEDKDPRPDGEDERVIYEMAEHMIDEGARCGNLARNKMRAVCLGTLGVSLMAAAQDPNASAVAVRALAQAMLAAGARPDNVESASDGGHVLAAAAASGNAAAVSVLLTFRVNPDRRDADNRGVPHLVGRNSGSSAPLQLQILRHFIGGLGAAGKADSFNGWNASSDLGRPLDALQNHAPIFAEGLTAKREIQALLYERGARCASPEGKTYCQIPAETALIPSSPPDTVGPVLTVTARDFGGTFFDLQLPDAVTAMSLRGWRMDRFYGPPRRVELSRTRPLMPGDDFPTVAVTMLNGEQAVRRINIASQSAGAPFIVTVIGQGSVSIAANGAPIQNGGTILQHYHVEIVATPDSAAYHVSDWSGPCATARKGADGGERTCDLIFNEEDNRVTVTFSPGRLGLHLPATGYIPDGPVEFKDTGKTELAYFCGLLGGTTTERVSETSRLVKDVCQTFGGISVYGRCDSPGQTAGFDDRPDCGGSYFSHIRGCNAQNKPATSTTACGAACNAAMGMVARGRGCASVSDQCAASPAPACHADAACADPDVFSNDAPAELCACNRGFHGDGLSCRSTTPTIERFPFFVTVVGQGAVRSIRAGGELIQSGQSIQANLGVEIVAAPGRAYHVSDWTGPCAAAPKGADGGERTCEFFFNPETNRVTVAFSPGRLAPTLPASGDVPDGPTSFENVGASELAHFCRLLGGRTNSVVSKGLTKVLCVMPGFPNSGGGGDQCDSPGTFGFDDNVDNCGPHVFGRIRDCNVENKPGLSHSACGAACNAAAGMAARGLSCEAVGDQCAAPFLPSGCDAQAVCSDPDVELTNTPAELCTCTGGLAGDGVACGQQAASAGLLAEVKKPAGAANVSMVLTLLGFGANADIADGNGDAALIIAATLGHAEIVSVLVTAGANANARWNRGNPGQAVPHVAAVNNFAAATPTLHYPWKTALNVLRHFADAVNQKGATYNWTSNGGGTYRAIAHLKSRYSNGAAVWGGDSVWPAESVSVKYEAMEEIADILLENGDDCPDRHITCQGSLRAALADVVALGAVETSAADVRAAAQTVIAAGINLRTAQRDAGHNGGGYLVAIAAARGHAEAVSVLVTFGADAGGKTSNGRAALHHVGRGSGDDAPGRLTVLRYFIGGLRAAGKLDTFAGWNAGSGIGFPLDILQNHAPKPTDAAAREIQKLLWEGGSRCATQGAKTYCQIPREERLVAAYSAGSGLTVRGRDFRGTVFVFSPPSAELNMSLAASGWRATLESSGEEFVILRTPQQSSDTSVEFTVTAFAGAGGDAVRVYDIEAVATATVGVSYKTDPEDGSRGRVSASGEGLIGSNAVYAGSRVTFTATPESGHGVFAWETNGADCPRGALKCVAVAPVDSDLLVTARFEPTYPAGYGEMPNDKTGGTLTAEGLVGEDRVFSGTTVTFRARPAAGWLFSAWQGDGAADCLPSDLECELPAGNDGLFVTVQFVQGRLVEYQADPSDESGGTLTVAGLARDNTALAGALVTFTASPAPGWELSAWEGDVSGCVAPNLECILPADDDLRVTAVFLQSPQIRYEANPPDESGGSVTVLGVDGNAGGVDFVYSGGTVTFTATLVFGWELSAWEGCSSSGLECVLTANANVQVTAHFSQAPRVRYAANPPDNSGGRVMVAGVDGNTGGADFVYSGGTVTFTATPAFGWEVSAWEGDVGDCVAPALECEAAANMDLYVTVGFSRVTVRVEAAKNPAEGGSVTVQLPGLDYAFLGSDVTFTATPADGWYAAGWEGLGTAGCAGLECVVMIATEADVLVTVRFAEVEAQTVRVEYASDPPYAGKLSVELPGLDFAFLGATVTFTATPADHWLVEGWFGEGTAGCSGLTCEAVADGDLYVTVRFAAVVQATVAVEYETVPEGGGGELTVELPGGNFAFAGVTVTFTATPMPGWTIEAWEGDAIVSCSASSLTCVLIAGSDLVVGVRFRQYDCVAENREGSGSACGACKAGYGEMGSYCVEKATGDFGIAPQSEICRALQGGGEAAPARLEGDGEMKVCSGVDVNDTFCILDSVDGLPCRGLFRHVLRCNIEFERVALNPFFCGKKCEDDPSKPRAVGRECRP